LWRHGVILSCLVLLVVIVVRMRPPSIWSQTQFLFTYDLGFQRRALLGEGLARIFPDGLSAANTYLVAAAMTVGATAFLFAFVLRAFHGRGPSDGTGGAGLGLALVLFATSVGLATFIGNTGNLDALLMIVALACLWPNPRQNSGPMAMVARSVVVSLTLAGATLIHENVLPYFAVLVGLDQWLKTANQPTARRVFLTVLPLVLTAIAAIIVIRTGTHPVADLKDLVTAARQRSLDFPIRVDTFDPIVSLPNASKSMLSGVWSSGFYRFRLTAFGGSGLLLLAAMLVIVLRAAAHRPTVDKFLMIGAVLSPVSLLLIAFDVSRFASLGLINSYLVMAILSRADHRFAAALKRQLGLTTIVVLLVVHGNLMLRDLNAGRLFTSGFPGALVTFGEWTHP